jgi:hypothetical protein
MDEFLFQVVSLALIVLIRGTQPAVEEKPACPQETVCEEKQ